MAKRSKDVKTSESVQTVSVISLEKTIVQRAYDYSVKKGYDAALEHGVLMFPHSDDNKRITDDLLSQFGYERKEEIAGVMKTVKRLPFSYGFADKKNFASKQTLREEVSHEEVEELDECS